MIIMALDHVRDFFHAGAMSFQPDDLSRTTALLFFTRWITHFCAPTFAFLAGVGAFLWLDRGHSPRELSAFLWRRGLWLILLDLTVVRLAMFFSLTSGPVILSVLWALGWSMIILALLVRLPVHFIAVFSLGVILLHNLADPIQASAFGPLAWLWNVLHQQGVISIHGIVLITAYPVLPWAAVMAAGFCFGRVARLDGPRRHTILVRLGVGLTLGFVLLRYLNFYGDPQPWSVQSSPLRTVLSFLRTTKYPPSLDFLLMTLGPAMLIWAWFDRMQFSEYNPLIVFGRVPLFYFVVHLFVIHALAFPFALLYYGSAGFLLSPLPSMGGSAAFYPPGFGYSLNVVYGVWFLVLALMYLPCLYFARLKARRRDPWLSYL